MKPRNLQMTRPGLEPGTYGLKVERGGTAGQRLSSPALGSAPDSRPDYPVRARRSVTNPITTGSGA